MGAKLKRLKRPSAGPSDLKKAATVKKPRGPKPYISMPSTANGADEDEDEEDARLAALEAEDMATGVAGGSDDSDEESAPAATALNGNKGAAFLLNLDQKGISRSRAEEKRLKKSEKKAQRNQEMQDLAEGEDAESDVSTDMEGASEGSSAEEEDDEEDNFSGFDSDDFESDLGDSEDEEDMGSVDPTDSSEDENDDRAERKYQERIRAATKRQQAEEAQQAQANKRRKLPVRGEEGKWQEGSDEEGARPHTDNKGRTNRAIHSIKTADAPSDDEDASDAEPSQQTRPEPVSTILSGARFGMQAPYTIMTMRPRSARIAAAREQIARLSNNILGDPEVSLGLLRRLSVFAQRKIFRPEHDSMARSQDLPEFIEVDDAIRGAALMSLTAVYVDILPGYRIRALTETEQAEKVNQETARRREWEQGLVDVYRQHLEVCEKILKAKVPAVSSLALRSMALLLTRATHFNYRTNLIAALVSQLSRRSWSPDSQLCSDSLVEVLRRDLAGDASLEVVRFLNRMIKERGYKVNARVLNILLHLRLRDELGNKRADTVRADRDKKPSSSSSEVNGKKFKTGKGKAKPGDVRKGQGQHLSKKQVKLQREMKEVEKDMKEAEAEVDKEEREKNQTETLKLLFVLYFSILKADAAPGPLLGAALEGLARFAHRVNVDFFRDLLVVLRNHVKDARSGAIARSKILHSGQQDGDADAEAEAAFDEPEQDDTRKALLCLVTAFELLSGQGEALNIDLSDMVSHLYAILLPICSSSTIENVPVLSNPSAAAGTGDDAPPRTGKQPQQRKNTNSTSHLLRTDADLLLRALDLCLLRPRLSDLPSERSAAFIKRMLICTLYTPPTTTLRLLGVVRSMIGKDPKLEALLDTEDRAKNGRYDPGAEDEDVEMARPLAAGEVAWELHVLARHVNIDIATTASGILAFQSA